MSGFNWELPSLPYSLNRVYVSFVLNINNSNKIVNAETEVTLFKINCRLTALDTINSL